MEDSDWSSDVCSSDLIEYLHKAKYPNIPQALNEALQFANQQIMGYAAEHPESKGMGTTACVLLIQDNRAWIAHAGDSRIYLYLGNERQLHRITKDHSFVQTLVDMGEIRDDEAEHHPHKNRILKALGIKPDLQPEVCLSPVFPKKDDVFLICSDGLSGMINDLSMEGVLTKNTTIAEKGQELIQMALDNGGLDNVTLQLIQINNSPYKETVFVSKNPIGRPQNQHPYFVSRPKQIEKIVKWAAIAAAGLLIIVMGSLFFYGKHLYIDYEERKSNIKKLETEVTQNEKNKDEAKEAMTTAEQALTVAQNRLKTAEKAEQNTAQKAVETQQTATNEARQNHVMFDSLYLTSRKSLDEEKSEIEKDSLVPKAIPYKFYKALKKK
jgi:serine/threonine protein phosphatase PrpC